VAMPIEQNQTDRLDRPQPKKECPSQAADESADDPSRIVMMQPEGSRPGTKNFASVPATRPRRIQ